MRQWKHWINSLMKELSLRFSSMGRKRQQNAMSYDWLIHNDRKN